MKKSKPKENLNEYEEMSEKFKKLVHKRVGPIGKGEYLDCPYAKSEMTPCLARDGYLALTTDGHCVGCGLLIWDLLKKEEGKH